VQITPTEFDEEITVNPVLNFFFALKAPESKRQYPKRFEKFLDYLTLEDTFEDKAFRFLLLFNLYFKFSIISFYWLE
jgi:hypothetical protein